MYGKIFEEIFCSTLMDLGGDTAYVFIAMIILSDENGVIKHTAESLARVICKDADSVREAIKHLEAPDPRSNLKGHDGRRIVPLYVISQDETRGWLVVNKAHYRDRRSASERRDYMREYMQKYRNENKGVNSSKQDVNCGKSDLTELANTDTDTDTDTQKSKEREGAVAPTRSPRKRFEKPSLQEIREYCEAIGSTIKPASFFNHYESKGWLVGKSPMKDWRAAVRGWTARES